VHRVTVVVSPPAAKMPQVSSALGRGNSETECTDGVAIEDGNLYAQEDAWRQNIPPKCCNI